MAPNVNSKKQGEIVVTAQQSRFHVDATESASKEIDVKDINLTVGGRELLSHANLKLGENKHYVLVGRNGTGKSSLLRAMAESRIPGIPWNIRMLLLGQTDLVNTNVALLEPEMAKISFDSGTVFEHVLRSDAARERAIVEAKLLTDALENTQDPLAVVRAIRKLNHNRLSRKHAEIADIASRRSGSRGAKARKELIQMDSQLAASALLVEQSNSDIDPSAVPVETSQAVDTLAQIQSTLDAMDSAAAETKARTVLLGLGFSEDAISRPFTTLSGGWRTRCSLACALFQKVDILLLDECTNFLDLVAVVWLQGYIQTLTDTTVVVITHDRDFADAVGDELLVLREQILEHFKGTLSAYEHERRVQTRYMSRMQAAQEKKTKHMESSIASALNAARRAGDDKKLKQAASRRKKIEERSGLEVGLRGGRFKLNRDLPGYHTSMRDAIETPTVDPQVKITIPSEPPDLRFPGALVSLENVTFSYPGPRKNIPIVSDINLVIHPGQRVGLAGLNGAGKSTVVELVVGDLTATKGTVTRHSRARYSCFSQHAVEALEKKGAQYPELTSLKELMQHSEGTLVEQDARKVLGGLGLQGKIASDVPVAALSGGQKVRLALAKLIYSPPHLLVLDEVTTHLDSDTVLALVYALKNYQGALLVITHDRFFMRCVVEGDSPDSVTGADSDNESDEDDDGSTQKGWQAEPGVVYRLVKGQLKVLDGGMRKYEAIAERASNKLNKMT